MKENQIRALILAKKKLITRHVQKANQAHQEMTELEGLLTDITITRRPPSAPPSGSGSSAG